MSQETSATEGAPSPAPESHGPKGPGFPVEDQEVTCPSCGRFAGTYERCPFCGTHMETRLSVRLLRRLCLVVAFSGLALTWWAARNMEVPLRKVGDFEPTMNFAILRVRGEIVAGPYYGDRGDSFYVGIDDGSGRINAKGYGKIASTLRSLELGRGDRVEARGSIRIQAGKPPSMSLRIPDDLHLLSRGEAPTPRRSDEVVTIGSLTREMAGERVKVRVRGVLEEVWTKGKVGKGALLRDPSGELKLWVYANELDRLGASAEYLAPGKYVEVVGRLDLYRRRGGDATLQLRPFKAPDAIQLVEGKPPVLPPRAEKPVQPAPSRKPRPRPQTSELAPEQPADAPEAPVAPSPETAPEPAPSPATTTPPAPPSPPAVPGSLQGARAPDLGGALRGMAREALEPRARELLGKAGEKLERAREKILPGVQLPLGSSAPATTAPEAPSSQTPSVTPETAP